MNANQCKWKIERRLSCLAIAGAALMALPLLPAHAMTDAELATALGQRLHGDRTGACVAAAVIDQTVSRAYVCANAGHKPRIGPEDAFEIGSVSKTMTATLLAELIDQGKASLADPLSAWLPRGTKVPQWKGQPIRLRDIVTHSSGLPALPPGVAITNPADPYAAMTPQQVIDALGQVTLKGAPGTQPQYSNFAMMLLSWGIAHRTGTDFDKLLQQKLFQPLGMHGAWVHKVPDGLHDAVGHLPSGQPTPAWRFPKNMAGVGGVRATLDAMVKYVQAELKPDTSTRVGKAIALTHTQPDVPDPLARGINWFIESVEDRAVYLHEGGTGGFSSLVAFDPKRQRGVVLLSDTSWTSTGGLGKLGMHLLDAKVPLDGPRKLAQADTELLKALSGQYLLDSGMPMTLSHKDGKLYIQAAGQPQFEMGYDSVGDFYPLKFDALLHPVHHADGHWSFAWRQGGGEMQAKRTDRKKSKPQTRLDQKTLDQYTGTYPLMPGFELTVTAADGQLKAQATGQGAFPLENVGKDKFEAAAYGIQINFQRNDQDKVTSLDLLQGGHTLHGDKQ